MTAITLARPHNGIGDWLFALACLKHVNRQRPDVAVHVDFGSVEVGRLPGLVPDLYRISDVRYQEGKGPSDSRVTRDSLVYRARPPESFIESTLLHLEHQTGLGLVYEPGLYPDFGARPEPRGYVAMIAHGKRRSRGGKDWGPQNFQMLADILRSVRVDVVQVGGVKDARLEGVRDRVLGQSGTAAVAALCGASLFVGIENGVMVLAGYLGVRQLTIYDGAGFPSRVDFPHQAKWLERAEPEGVAERIVEMMAR